MNNIIQTIIDRQDDLKQAIFTHTQISLASLFIAMLIAIPMAILLMNRKKIAEGFLSVISVFQTIPSLAILGMLIPLIGIGSTPALITLTLYALMPIFQNTYIGLTTIDPNLEEAADAFGMDFWYKLIKIQIPLAMPMIISGIRIALVLIIGTATIAALIGAGGLGSFILLGIDRNDQSLIIIGAFFAALLALIFSFFVKKMEKTSLKTNLIALLSFIVIFFGLNLVNKPVVSAKKPVTIAGKLGSEPEIIINMYKYLIEDNSDKYEVELKPNFGKTQFLFNALKSKDVDLYLEFTGTVLDSLVKNDNKTVKEKEEVFNLANKLLKEQHQLMMLPPMEFENTYALAVKKDFAKKYNITTISDLKKVEDKLKGGFTLEFIDRDDGLRGIKKTYDLNIDKVSMEPSLRYLAIANNEVNIVDAYSTDSEIAAYDLVVLKDDKKLFPAYQGAPLASIDFFNNNPELVHALEKLSNHISEQDMQYMNYLVNDKNKKPANVAKEYLENNNFITKKE